MLLVGHRGARGEAPENTLAGFAHALRTGVGALELDVRLSADERLVVIHDATVDRTTDRTGPVSGFTAAELGRLDARGDHHSWPEPVGVPTLEAVLERFGGRVRLAIEIKRDAPERIERVAELLVAAIRARHLTEHVVVTSFEPDALAAARRLAPEVERAYIGAFDAPAFLDTASELGCAQVDVPVATGSAEVVREAQARGMRVCGWLGNAPGTLQVLVGWGVDAITTDYPTIAARELAR
jgi:glycerophosphoryl diester phosphodiesterase